MKLEYSRNTFENIEIKIFNENLSSGDVVPCGWI